MVAELSPATSEDAGAAHSNGLHDHLILLVTLLPRGLVPNLTRHLAEQPADRQPAVDGNAGHGAVLLHCEGVDAAGAEASGLRDVCWDPCCVMVYAGGEGQQGEAGEVVR